MNHTGKKKHSRASHFVVMSLWFGLAYGLVEAFLLLGLYEFTHYLMWRNGVGPEILWVAPVVDTGFFLLAGLAMWILFVALGPERESLAWAITFAFFALIAGLGLLSTPLAIQELGCLILALGISVQTFRWARKKSVARPLNFFRRTLKPLVVVAVLVALVGIVWPKWRERQFLASLPPPKPGQPNVLLVVLDTCRADHMSIYGYPRKTTPNIERLGSEGMVFEKAFSGSTNSPPAHLSLMSEVEPDDWYQGILHGRFHDLLSETLAKRGYANVACIANNEWVIPQLGLGRGFARFQVYFHNVWDKIYRTFYGKLFIYIFRWWGGYFVQPGGKQAPEVNRELLEWIDKTRPTGRPFFALLNYFDTHDPRLPPEPYATEFSPRVTRKNVMALFPLRCRVPNSMCSFKNLPLADRQLIIDDYDGSLAYLDHWIGQLEDELARRDVLNDTLIILVGDHGESLGENDIWGHILPVMREEVTHVPLILRYPTRVPGGVRVAYPVSLLQVPATVADVVGLGGDSPYRRKSLLKNWQEPSGPVVVESEGNYSLALGNWHLIVTKDGKKQLYDLDHDPHELTDLAGRPETATIEADLRRRLADLQQSADPATGSRSTK